MLPNLHHDCVLQHYFSDCYDFFKVSTYELASSLFCSQISGFRHQISRSFPLSIWCTLHYHKEILNQFHKTHKTRKILAGTVRNETLKFKSLIMKAHVICNEMTLGWRWQPLHPSSLKLKFFIGSQQYKPFSSK